MSEQEKTIKMSEQEQTIKMSEQELREIAVEATTMSATGNHGSNEAQAGAPDPEIAAMFDLSARKKKKKKTKTITTDEKDAVNTAALEECTVDENTSPIANASSPGVSSREKDIPSYDYSLLLDRVCQILSGTNPDWKEKPRNSLKPPQLVRVGTKKTMWTNYQGR